MNRVQRLVCLYLMGREARSKFEYDEARSEFELFLHRPEVWEHLYAHNGHTPGTDAGPEEFVYPEDPGMLEDMLRQIRKDLG